MPVTLAQVGSLFTAPWLAAAGAAAVTIPVAIHLLVRFRRQRHAWGAMRFLLQTYRRHRRRLRLEQWLLLATRCLLVLLLGLALAGPLMGGFVSRFAGGFDQRGRVVHLLISDGLASQASTPQGETRLDRLKAQAKTLVDGLDQNDRVALWRTGRPAGPAVESPTLNHTEVRQALEELTPRPSRPDLPAALGQIADQLQQQDVPPDRGLVLVVSDFPRAADYLRRSPDSQLRRLSDHARLAVARPAPEAGNGQIQTLAPRRRLVIAEPGTSVEVPVTANLRRLSDGPTAEREELELTLMNAAGDIVASQTRPVSWRQGQSSTRLNMTLAANPDQRPEAPQNWLLRARRVEPANDRLSADDTAWASVDVRPHLTVGLVGGQNSEAPEDGLSPHDWLALALSPYESPEAGAIRQRELRPAELDQQKSLAELDAAFILRPDRVSAAGWDALARFARDGGLVWVTPPRAGLPQSWVDPLREAFALDWQMPLETRSAPEDEPARLDSDHPAPPALDRLAAGWADQLRPVRVHQWLPIAAPDDATWLRLEAGPDGPGGAILAGRSAGAGHVLVQGVALDPDWTNMPAKPLIVPLLHEGLRGVLGGAGGQQPKAVLAGDRPSLGPRWEGVDHLRRIQPTEENEPPPLPLAGDETPTPAEAFRWPGIYRAADSGLTLAVNVDPAGGDLRATTQQQLSQWLDQFAGDSWQFMPEEEPASILARGQQRAGLGWPLLWLVLGLAIVEMFLARYFSHARQTHQPGFHQRVAGLWRQLRHGPPRSRGSLT